VRLQAVRSESSFSPIFELNPVSGTGAYKLGVNYAPGIIAQKSAIAQGYAQNLWLHGPEHYLTEVRLSRFPPSTRSLNITQVGTMNMFVVFKTKDGGEYLFTILSFHALIFKHV
jgi:branched-chain amino acid aminotransferase